MKKNNGAGRIVALILVLLAMAVFAVFSSGIKIDFIENYSYNFRINLLALGKKFGIEFSEPVQDFLQDLPDKEVQEEQIQNDLNIEEAVPENAEDIKEVEFEEPELENKRIKNNPVALENSQTAEFAEYRGYLLCVNPTAVIAYDKDGNVMWTQGIHMNNPILSVSGNYYMIAERGGRKIALFDGKKRIYQTEAEGAVKTASVSANGDVVVTSDKEYYKGAVLVINKNGDRVFSWNSGVYPILDADIASGSRNIAVSLMNTEHGANSVVYFFEIVNGEKISEVPFENSLVFDLEFLNEILNVFADNKVVGVSQRGKILWEAEYEDRKLLSYENEDNGYKLLMLDNNNTLEMEFLTNRGRVKSTILAETAPEFADIKSGLVAYGTGRELLLSAFSGRQKKTYSAPKEICGVYILDNNYVVAVYNHGLDFIKFV